MNRFDLLPIEIKNYIYEFDGTKKENLDKVVDDINNKMMDLVDLHCEFADYENYSNQIEILSTDKQHVLDYLKENLNEYIFDWIRYTGGSFIHNDWKKKAYEGRDKIYGNNRDFEYIDDELQHLANSYECWYRQAYYWFILRKFY